MTAPHILVAAAVGAGLALAAAVDLRDRRIPNQIVGGLALSGLVHSFIAGGALDTALALLGGVIGFALLLLPWRGGLIGGGDVKLLAAIGVWVGPSGVLRVLLAAAVLGGVLAIYALLRLAPEERREVFGNVSTILRQGEVGSVKRSATRTIPFGVALAAAAMWVIGRSALGGV